MNAQQSPSGSRPPSNAAWTYAETWLDDAEPIRAARAKAADLGIVPVSQAVANTLSLLAASIAAGAVVEVGTGTGVSGAALLAGMTDDGVLTSIDTEAENQRAARDLFTAIGVGLMPLGLLKHGGECARRDNTVVGNNDEVVIRRINLAYELRHGAAQLLLGIRPEPRLVHRQPGDGLHALAYVTRVEDDE